jgi:hypothetical protein
MGMALSGGAHVAARFMLGLSDLLCKLVRQATNLFFPTST